MELQNSPRLGGKQARDVARVRRHAVCVIELSQNNQKASKPLIRYNHRLQVIAVVGCAENGNEAVLLEIGIQRGSPWQGTHKRRIPPRWRTVKFVPNRKVLVAIFDAIERISTHLMRDWQSGSSYIRSVTVKRGKKRLKQTTWSFNRGIRFAFDPQDKVLIHFLQMQEVHHNPKLRELLRYRRDGLLYRLKNPRALRHYRNGKPTKAAQKVLGYFNTKTLCDPVVLRELLRLMYGGNGTVNSTPAMVAFVEFLVRHGIAEEDFFTLTQEHYHKKIPKTGVVCRYVRKRRNGQLVYTIYPVDPVPF